MISVGFGRWINWWLPAALGASHEKISNGVWGWRIVDGNGRRLGVGFVLLA